MAGAAECKHLAQLSDSHCVLCVFTLALSVSYPSNQGCLKMVEKMKASVMVTTRPGGGGGDDDDDDDNYIEEAMKAEWIVIYTR